MIEFILDARFLIPLLSTLGASLAIITGQQLFGFSARQRKKLYCISYISDVALRLLHSNLVIKKNTVLPHIVATKRIIKGDSELLDTMFKADEFSILDNQRIEFNHLPQEYKLLVGYDDMRLLQAIELLNAMSLDNSPDVNLNVFVKDNLKSELKFKSKNENERRDILNMYWDYLDNILRQTDRLNSFIIHVIIPMLEKYKNKFQFKFFSKKNINENIGQIRGLQKMFKDLIPAEEQIAKNIQGGIQKVL